MTTRRILQSIVATLPMVCAMPAFCDPDPDLTGYGKAVVIVIAKGVDPTLGNKEAAVQGTGFFVSKDGYLVTAYHLRKDLGAVAPDTVTYELHLAPGDVVQAAPVFTNQFADIMVLYASVGDRDLPILRPSDRQGVNPGTTPIYTVGYPSGYRVTYDKGIIKSFGGMVAPLPVWSTSLTFKNGQSGSPILLANGRVIAVAKSVDQDATSIGLVVPIRLVPTEYYDGAPGITRAEGEAIIAGKGMTASHVTVSALLKETQPRIREQKVELSNAACAAPAIAKSHVDATPGWTIDPASIRLTPVSAVGGATALRVVDAGKAGFDVAGRLTNVGACVNAFNVKIQGDIPAKTTVLVTYKEIPGGNLARTVTFADALAVGDVKVPLPNVPTESLQFTVRNAEGKSKTFEPVAADFTKKDGRTFLDAKSLTSRILF